MNLPRMVLSDDSRLLAVTERLQKILASKEIDPSGDHNGIYAVCEALEIVNPRQLLKNRSVLIVDDDEATLRLVAWALYAGGTTVSYVTSGHQAIRVTAGDADFDLVLMDVCMPVMDGLDTAKQLREHEFGGPIVLFTAQPDVLNWDAAKIAGCQACVGKGIGPYHLLAIISTLLAPEENHES